VTTTVLILLLILASSANIAAIALPFLIGFYRTRARRRESAPSPRVQNHKIQGELPKYGSLRVVVSLACEEELEARDIAQILATYFAEVAANDSMMKRVKSDEDEDEDEDEHAVH